MNNQADWKFRLKSVVTWLESASLHPEDTKKYILYHFTLMYVFWLLSINMSGDGQHPSITECFYHSHAFESKTRMWNRTFKGTFSWVLSLKEWLWDLSSFEFILIILSYTVCRASQRESIRKMFPSACLLANLGASSDITGYKWNGAVTITQTGSKDTRKKMSSALVTCCFLCRHPEALRKEKGVSTGREGNLKYPG